MDDKELYVRFSHHKPDIAKGNTHSLVRGLFHELAEKLNTLVPESREKAVTITKIEEAMFWANAAIARND